MKYVLFLQLNIGLQNYYLTLSRKRINFASWKTDANLLKSSTSGFIHEKRTWNQLFK